MSVKTKEIGTRVTDTVLPNLLFNREEMAKILVDQLPPLYCDHCLIHEYSSGSAPLSLGDFEVQYLFSMDRWQAGAGE